MNGRRHAYSDRYWLLDVDSQQEMRCRPGRDTQRGEALLALQQRWGRCCSPRLLRGEGAGGARQVVCRLDVPGSRGSQGRAGGRRQHGLVSSAASKRRQRLPSAETCFCSPMLSFGGKSQGLAALCTGEGRGTVRVSLDGLSRRGPGRVRAWEGGGQELTVERAAPTIDIEGL